MSLFSSTPSFWLDWFLLCGIIMSAYFVFAGSVYWLLFKRLKQPILKARMSDGQRRSPRIANDIKLSVLSAILFSLGAASFLACYSKGLTKVYIQADIHDLGYIILSYVVVLVLQDTYFYFMHRLFHQPILFKRFHWGHHQSRPPTPWTFFALEPAEAAAQACFLLSITFVLPLHMGVLVAILLTMTIWAMGNHLGIHVIPTSWFSNSWGKYCIGSAHHLIHHQRYQKHYGLYFTFWDKVMGTQERGYEAQLCR